MYRHVIPIPRAPITNQLNVPTPPIVGLEPPPSTLQQNRLREHPSRNNGRKYDPSSNVLGTVQVTKKSSEISEHVQEPEAGTSGVPVMNVTPLKVNRTTVLDQFIVTLMKNKDHWHKFIIHDGAFFEKEDLLKLFLSFEFTTVFIPVMFQNEGTTSTFLARDCYSTIDKLVRSGFKKRLPGITDQKQKPVLLSVEVILCDTPVSSLGISIHADVTKCVKKRYNSRLKCLNLSNFHNDPDLQKFYCPLWIPNILHFVFTLGVSICRTHQRAVSSFIQSILLSNNGLTTLKFMAVRREIVLKRLKIFDLSNNKLESLDSLVVLQPLKLTELVLHNNPLCGKYTDEATYVREVLSVLPTLKKLDGVYVVSPGLPCWHRNYVVSEEGIELVDQFLEHYFTLYDSKNRQKMQDLYHSEACFSMSACYLPGQSTSPTARLRCYLIDSRNLLELSVHSKNYTLLSHGSKNVVTTLSRLPRTEHDPYSFAVDLSQYSPNHAVITVSGVFRESCTRKKWAVRSFNRTFVLLKVSNVQYVITNEILFFSNATTRQAEKSFQHSPPNVCMTKVALCIFENLTLPEKRHITNILAQLTEMNRHWARKCLEESKWNIREALQVFTELYKMNKIPAEAFVRD